MAFVSGFLIPLIKVTFIFGIVGWILFIIGKAFHNAWVKSWKFIWKYKIRKKAYPETTIDWIFSCIDANIGWYQAKKLLMVKMTPQPMINETLWIYDQIAVELNKENGGKKQNGRKFERGYSKEIGKLPNI